MKVRLIRIVRFGRRVTFWSPAQRVGETWEGAEAGAIVRLGETEVLCDAGVVATTMDLAENFGEGGTSARGFRVLLQASSSAT